MYPYQNQSPSSPGHQSPSASQHFLGNVESAANRFKRAFGRKRPSRADNDDQGTQSDAPSTRKTSPMSRISTFMPRKDPKPALQFAASSFQALGQRLNKPLPPRIPSQIEPPPEMDLPDPPRVSESSQKLPEPRLPHANVQKDPVPVPVPADNKPLRRTSELVEGPEISAAIEYMLDPPARNSGSPPPARMNEPVGKREPSPPSPRTLRTGSFENSSPTSTSNATKRRSMSLSMMPHFQPPSSTSPKQAPPSSFTMFPSPPQPTSAPHHRSHSALPVFISPSSASEPSAAKTNTYASGIISHTNPDKSSNHFKGKLATWSSVTTSTPSPSRSARNPSPAHSKTSSVVASIIPAASAATGMAVNLSKRAYEKVNSMWSPLSASAAGNGSGGGLHPSQGYESSGPKMSRGKSRLNGNGHGHGSYGGSFSDVEPSRRRQGSPGGMEQPVGPNLGPMLRPPFRRSFQGGGLVFGRPLVECVRDTKPLVVVGDEGGAGIEARFIPALVLRCVQHIEHWGITEEGLFRISGRASHINKLRAEFASGADYDLQTCGPGDLDPHAVASVLKAFLRELPEPVLTRAKAPLYDAAFEKAKDASFMLATSSAPPTLGYNSSQNNEPPSGPRIGLPSGPRDTATMPSRNRQLNLDIHPDQAHEVPEDSPPTPQQALEELVAGFQELTSSLPRENRDLLMTIAELLGKAARQSRATKMPLSNLLLVLCPSMSMNPGVLKIFVEHHHTIFAEPRSASQEQVPPTPFPIRPPIVATQDSNNLLGSAPAGHDSNGRTETETNPSEATSAGDLKLSSEDMIPKATLPVRKQSLRRLTQGGPGIRTTPTSSPSAYRETFSTEPVPGYPDYSGKIEATHISGGDGSIAGQPKSSSTPASPLHQSFSASDLSRPAQPLGPRGPRSIPAPLALQRQRSNTSERIQTITRPSHLRSASSSSALGRDMPPSPSTILPIKVEEPINVPTLPIGVTESLSSLTPQNIESDRHSSQGNTIDAPSLPDVPLLPPMTSSFTEKRISSVSPAMVNHAYSSSASSDIPLFSLTPQTATSGTSSQGATLIIPSLPEVQPLPPITSSFTNLRSSMPVAGVDHAQPSPASLGAPSPGSTQSSVQALTPLLVAMEKENASSLAASPNSSMGELDQAHQKVEPLTVIKKLTASSASQAGGQVTSEYDGTAYSASSATTDTSDATNIFDPRLSWPEVPKTTYVVKPSQTSIFTQPLTSISTDPASLMDLSTQSQNQEADAQYVTAKEHDGSDLTAATVQRKFPKEPLDNDFLSSPVVANGQYPPEPYPLIQSIPHLQDEYQPKKSETSSHDDLSDRMTISLSQPYAMGLSSSGDVPSPEITMRSMHTYAPRLTVNSKEMLSGNGNWAAELQRVFSPATHPHEARLSTELSSMAAGT